jgi:hypothetical protein
MDSRVSSAKATRGYELVFTVADYYDGPRQGVANYRGEPHFYDCVFDQEEDEYSDLYRLTPIDQRTFELAVEAWAIWRKWELAYHSGKVKSDSHPALRADTTKYKRIWRKLDASLKTDSARCISRKGHFKAIEAPKLPKGVLRPFQVKWLQPERTR